MDLQRGGNAPLAARGRVTVVMEYGSAPEDLDLSCYMVGASGKVPSDSYMVFYNQASDPERSVQFSQQGTKATFTIDLDRIAPTIQKCVFAATLASGVFKNVRGLAITGQGDSQPVRYSLTEGTNEKAMIVAEAYRHSSGWKLRAVGQGLNGGLKALAESFGVVVEADAAPPPLQKAPPPPSAAKATTSPSVAKPTPPPAATPSASPIRLGKIVLDKPNAAARLNLSKSARNIRIGVKMTWQTGVDLDLHAFYKLKDGQFGHVYFAGKGSLDTAPYIALDRDAAVDRRSGNHEENLTISRMEEVEEILFATNIFTLGGLFGLGNENFAKYDGVVTVSTGEQDIVVPLTSKEPGRWAVIAYLENKGEPKVTRIDRVVKKEPKLEEYRGVSG